MECPNGCKVPMQEKKVEKIFHRNNKPIVIGDLNIYQCMECGHESIPVSSAKTVEGILKGNMKPSGQFNAELYEASAGKI